MKSKFFITILSALFWLTLFKPHVYGNTVYGLQATVSPNLPIVNLNVAAINPLNGSYSPLLDNPIVFNFGIGGGFTQSTAFDGKNYYFIGWSCSPPTSESCTQNGSLYTVDVTTNSVFPQPLQHPIYPFLDISQIETIIYDPQSRLIHAIWGGIPSQIITIDPKTGIYDFWPGAVLVTESKTRAFLNNGKIHFYGLTCYSDDNTCNDPNPYFPITKQWEWYSIDVADLPPKNWSRVYVRIWAKNQEMFRRGYGQEAFSTGRDYL